MAIGAIAPPLPGARRTRGDKRVALSARVGLDVAIDGLTIGAPVSTRHKRPGPSRRRPFRGNETICYKPRTSTDVPQTNPLHETNCYNRLRRVQSLRTTQVVIDRGYFTVHSCSPAENLGCIATSIRSAPVVTGANVTRLKPSRDVPYGLDALTGVHVPAASL